MIFDCDDEVAFGEICHLAVEHSGYNGHKISFK